MAEENTENNSSAPTEQEQGNNLHDPNIDDEVTDKAVKDIATKEGDTVLEAEDAATAPPKPKPSGWKAKLKSIFKDKRTWIGLTVLLLVLFAVPFTRYKVLGLAIKKQVTITVVDSQSGKPVSAAQVKVSGGSGKTDGNGNVRLRARVGSQTVTVQKTYYKQAKDYYFVGLKSPIPKKVKLVATGRLVPVKVVNKITGQPLKGVEIKVLNTSAKTDAKGQATVALPAKNDSEKARLSLTGFNPLDTTLKVTNETVDANNFQLVPAGHIYFLSNLSGTIDVVRSDLDGSARKTVFKGTGKENAQTTSLLVSRDWNYAVLKANREGSKSALFVIDGSNDKVTQFDSSAEEFNLIGWYGHAFMYELTHYNFSIWQPGRQQVKSYDADHAQLNQLDQTGGEGANGDYAYQSFYNYYIVDGALVYNTQWYGYPAARYDNKNSTIRAVGPDGRGKKDYQSWPAKDVSSFSAVLYEPNAVYYSVYNSTDNKSTYYAFEHKAVSTVNIDSGAFNRDYPTYLLSPDGSHTFWSELRDGKNTLFVGDSEAKSKQQLDAGGDYAPYGWYSNDYILVSKSSSELYILPVKGKGSKRQPLKISNYYKPPQTYRGYGYGYGGL